MHGERGLGWGWVGKWVFKGCSAFEKCERGDPGTTLSSRGPPRGGINWVRQRQRGDRRRDRGQQVSYCIVDQRRRRLRMHVYEERGATEGHWERGRAEAQRLGGRTSCGVVLACFVAKG